MTFFDSIKTVFRKYAEFGGRASRPEFWRFVLFSSVVTAILNSLALPFDGRLFAFNATASSISVFTSFAGLWSLAVLVPSVAVGVRRLRDAGHEWTQLLWILLPVVGFIILVVRLADPGVASTAPGVEAPVSLRP